MMGDMLSYDHLHIVKSQILAQFAEDQGYPIIPLISAALSRTSSALRLKR